MKNQYDPASWMKAGGEKLMDDRGSGGMNLGSGSGVFFLSCSRFFQYLNVLRFMLFALHHAVCVMSLIVCASIWARQLFSFVSMRYHPLS